MRGRWGRFWLRLAKSCCGVRSPSGGGRRGCRWAGSRLAGPKRLPTAMREGSLRACVQRCVAIYGAGRLLCGLPLNAGRTTEVKVVPIGAWRFRLEPWPFAEGELTFRFRARHVAGKAFDTSAELDEAFSSAAEESLSVWLS